MKVRGLLGVLACVAALIAPTCAAAKPGYMVSPPSFSIYGKLPKSGGYRVYVAAWHSLVEITLSRGDVAGIYYVKGRANRHGIDADFGRFGHIHARFVGHRTRRQDLFPGCRGRRPIEVHGRLKGIFRFRGEGNYVEVSAARAKASYVRGFKETCYFGPDSSPSNHTADILEVSGETAPRQRVGLSSAEIDGIDATFAFASIYERIGRITAIKSTLTADESSRLEFDPSRGQPKTVEFSPAFPFHGSATYTRLAGGSTEWSGDLRAPFAGLGTVPLAGPSFHATACRVRIAQTISCDAQHGHESARANVAMARDIPLAGATFAAKVCLRPSNLSPCLEGR
jgi:hypothetical protein